MAKRNSQLTKSLNEVHALLMDDKDSQAREIAERLIVENPTSAACWEACAQVRGLTGDSRGAIDCQLKAISLDPDNLGFYVSGCHLYTDTQEWNACLGLAQEGLARQTKESTLTDTDSLTLCVGRALFELGKHREAMGVLAKLAPNYGEVGGPLWSRAGLSKRCKEGLAKERKGGTPKRPARE